MTSPVRPTTRAALPGGACLLLGVVAAALGLLPWLRTGLRLPVQNLWSSDTPPDLLPRVLLPFSQYEVTTIVGLLLTGAVVAGLVVRAAGPRVSRAGSGLVLTGLLVAQLVAVAQTAHAVDAGLPERRLAQLYLAALVVGSLASVLVGGILCWLVARAPRGGALLGLGLAVVPFASWAALLVVPDGATAGPGALALLHAVSWLPAVLLGVAVAWAGLGTVGRVLAGLVGLLCLWVGPAVVTAVVNALGSRALAREPTEMARYAAEVFVAALTQPALALPPLGVAVAVASIGLVVRRLVHRPRPA